MDDTLRALAVSEDSRLLAAGGKNDEVVVWKLETGSEVARVSAPGEVSHLSFHQNGLSILGADGMVLASGEDFSERTVHAQIQSPAAGWVGEKLLIAAGYEEALIYRRADLELLSRVPGRAYGVTGTGETGWIVLKEKLIKVGAEGEVTAERDAWAK
jgi:hypothetical protein